VVCPWNRNVNVPPPALQDIRWISLYCRRTTAKVENTSMTLFGNPTGLRVYGECTVCDGGIGDWRGRRRRGDLHGVGRRVGAVAGERVVPAGAVLLRAVGAVETPADGPLDGVVRRGVDVWRGKSRDGTV
jgi:hypothetical protein